VAIISSHKTTGELFNEQYKKQLPEIIKKLKDCPMISHTKRTEPPQVIYVFGEETVEVEYIGEKRAFERGCDE